MKEVVTAAKINMEKSNKAWAKRYSQADVEQVKIKRKLCALKNQAHLYFDKIWIYGYMTRADAYEWLAKWLGVTEMEAHMSRMKQDRLKEVVEASIQLLNDMRRLDLDFGAELKHPFYEIILPALKPSPNV